MQPQTYSRSGLKRYIALHFLTFASRGLTIPFINLFLKERGFTGTEIGVLISLGALIQLIMSPALNAIADRSGLHRHLLYVVIYGTTLTYMGLIASVDKVVIGGAVLLRSVVDPPVAALLSQLTITWLNSVGRSIYGRLRGWGSLGWGVTTLLSGRLYTSGGYPLLFTLAALINLLMLPFVSVLPHRTTDPLTSSSTRVTRGREFYVLMASIFLYFVGMNAVIGFGFIYFQQDLGASNEVIGILWAITALAEIPAMSVIDWLLRRTNVLITLIGGVLGMTAIWTAFSFLTGLDLLIPLMIVRGTFYTLHTVSVTLLVSNISDPTNAATNQALSQVTTPALAALLTGSASGWIFDHFGGRALFGMAGLAGILSAILLLTLRGYRSAYRVETQALR